jgi:uncharacterized protein YacL
MNKTLTGLVIGLIVSGLIIFSLVQEYNFLQVIIGFVIFIFPSIFLSSFRSRTASFILTIVATLFVYICYRFNFTNTWPGVAIALIIGLPLYFLKVSKVK